jgi:HEPN domain-containing protein
MMTAEEKYGYWLQHAQYDLVSATAMFRSKRWLYVAFMCQQAIEKLCKGLHTLYIGDDIPRIHNIKKVVDRFADKLPQPISDETYRFFDQLTSMYLNNRYPEFLLQLSLQMNKKEAASVLKQTQEVFKWLLTLKP